MARPSPSPEHPRYTVVAEAIDDEAWHLTVHELPDTWTVAFAVDEIEVRARLRIALDLDCDPSDFDIAVEPVGRLFLERRSSPRFPSP